MGATLIYIQVQGTVIYEDAMEQIMLFDEEIAHSVVHEASEPVRDICQEWYIEKFG